MVDLYTHFNKVFARISNMIRKSFVSLPGKDTGDYPYDQINYFGKTVNSQRILPYGYSATPPTQTMSLAVSNMGQEESVSHIPYGTKERFKNLNVGEVCVGSPVTGSYVKFNADKSISIYSLGKFVETIQSDVQINVTGNYAATISGTYSITSSGDYKITSPNLNFANGYGTAKDWTLTDLQPEHFVVTDTNKKLISGDPVSNAIGWNNAAAAIASATPLDTPNTLVKRDANGRAALALNDDNSTPRLSLDHNNRQLINEDGYVVGDWKLSQLHSFAGSVDYLSADWSNFTLNSWQTALITTHYITVAFESINWKDCQLKSFYVQVFPHPLHWNVVPFTSLDWKQCSLIGTDTNESLNWDGHSTNYYGGTNISIDYGGGALYDQASFISLDWANRFAYDASFILSIDWTNRLAIDNVSVNSIDWNSRALFDLTPQLSLNWNNRILYDNTYSGYPISTETPSFDWQNRQAFVQDPSNVTQLSLDYANGLLSSFYYVPHPTPHYINFTSLDWKQGYLYDMSGNISINWQLYNAFDTSAALSIDWNARQLFDNSGTALPTLDWEAKNTYHFENSNGGNYQSIDWQNYQLYGLCTKSRPIFPPHPYLDPFLSIDWKNCITYSPTTAPLAPSVASLDWQQRFLYYSDGASISIDYGSSFSYCQDGTLSIDWQNRVLCDVYGNAIVDWANYILSDSDGFPIIGFGNGNFYLNDGDSHLSVDYGARTLVDGSYTCVDWGNRNLNNSTGNPVLNFTNGIKFLSGSTGSGAALLGANSSSTHLTAPYTWIDVVAPDGTLCVMPIWKK